ncbi:MAG: ATP-binding protein [Rhodospirillales bacterium]
MPTEQVAKPLNVEDFERGRSRRWWMIAATACIGFTLTAVLSLSVLETVRHTKYAEIESRAADLAGRIETEFNVQLATLTAFRAFLGSNTDISPRDFTAYARNLGISDIGTIAYGWAPVRRAVDDGISAEPAFPVLVQEPFEALEALNGVDLSELSSVRGALRDSIDFNEIQISDPLSTETTGGKHSLVLAMFPLYRPGAPNFLLDQRRENVRGMLFSVLNPAVTIGYAERSSSLAEQIGDGVVGIKVTVRSGTKREMPLYRTGGYERLQDATENGVLFETSVSSRRLQIAQRSFQVNVVVASTALGAGPNISALSVLAIGLILTAAVVISVWSRARYDTRVAAMVTERTKALEASEQRLRDMADVSADWFWEMDSDLRFTYLSPRFEQVTGLTRNMFLGRTRLEAAGIANFRMEDNWREHLDDLEDHRPFTNFRYTITRGGGKEEFFSISGKPVFDADGMFIGYRGTGRDVTAEEVANRRMRESEARLQRNVRQLEASQQDLEESTAKMTEMAERYAVEKDRAEASERSKSEFLASMSHEIRTPMTGVMGFADMLLDSPLAPEDREKVIKIKGATQSLLTIINDILDLSKLDAGRLSIENLDFNVRAAVEEVLDLVRERARVKKLQLDFQFLDDMDVGMNGDPTRFRQILINLVGNAVKFTHKGGVSVHVSQSGEGENRTIEFRVIDSGIGISPENQKRLFTDFSQADASITRHYEGTGLGLAISKRLVELMGGNIWVESEVGAGSQFCFRLPFRKAISDVTDAMRHHAAEHFVTRRRLNVLVAEDNKLNQRIIAATLDKFGHDATIVENGEQAVEQVGKGEFDLILMDIRMPGMSGPEAARAIRARHDHAADIPIIALTADAMEEHIRGYLEAGMNACVTKPIDRAHLVATINEVLDEEVHVPMTEAEEARAGYGVPTEDEIVDGSANDKADMISVSDFLSQLDGVADDIERGKKAKS